MKKNKMLVAALVGGMLASGSAAAIVFGGSNLSLSRYPEHDCNPPYSKPTRPYSNDEWAIRSYNNEVDRYNDDMREFRQCALDYIENANNDIKRIQEGIQNVIDEAERM